MCTYTVTHPCHIPPLAQARPMMLCIYTSRYTRTTHAHDASRRAAPVRMCALRMRVGHGAQERLRLNRTWKVTIIYTWFVKTLHGVLSSFALSLVLACPLSFYCTLTSLLSLSQCRKPSAAFSIRLRKTRTLRKTNRVVLPVLHCQEAPFFPVLYRQARHPVFSRVGARDVWVPLRALGNGNVLRQNNNWTVNVSTRTELQGQLKTVSRLQGQLYIRVAWCACCDQKMMSSHPVLWGTIRLETAYHLQPCHV